MNLNDYNDLKEEMNREYEYNEEDYPDPQEDLTPSQIIRKYIPAIILIAIIFIFYKIGLLGKLLYLFNIFIAGIVIYSIVSIVIFKKSVKEVKETLMGIFSKIKLFVTRANKNYVETSQHLYDKYISDENDVGKSEYNSFAGVNEDPYRRYEEDLNTKTDNNNNPTYVNQKSNKYYEQIENENVFEGQEYVKDAELIKKNEDKYIINEDDQNNEKIQDEYDRTNGLKRVINDRSEVKTYKIQDNSLVLDNNAEVVEYYETSRTLDAGITPKLIANNAKIINNGGRLELYLQGFDVMGGDKITNVTIEYVGTIYKVVFVNLKELKLDGQMIITIDN